MNNVFKVFVIDFCALLTALNFSKNIPLFGAVHRYTNKCTTLLKRLNYNDISSGYALPPNV